MASALSNTTVQNGMGPISEPRTACVVLERPSSGPCADLKSERRTRGTSPAADSGALTAERDRQGIMKIFSGVIRSTTRIRSLVALLTLTAVGSSWLVLRADVPRVASGTWAAAGEVAVPSGAVSVTLADGRVVVAGGKSDGV